MTALIITIFLLIAILILIYIFKNRNNVINSENTNITGAKEGDNVYIKNSKIKF